jgi:hypothetical protein
VRGIGESGVGVGVELVSGAVDEKGANGRRGREGGGRMDLVLVSVICDSFICRNSSYVIQGNQIMPLTLTSTTPAHV